MGDLRPLGDINMVYAFSGIGLLEFSLAAEMPLLFSLLGISLAIGLFSGSYPAVYLSRFLPARSDHGRKPPRLRAGSQKIRGILVVFQFTLSIGLGICTAVIYTQTTYARNMDVGPPR